MCVFPRVKKNRDALSFRALGTGPGSSAVQLAVGEQSCTVPAGTHSPASCSTSQPRSVLLPGKEKEKKKKTPKPKIIIKIIRRHKRKAAIKAPESLGS